MLAPGWGQEVQGEWERGLPGEGLHLKPLPPLPFPSGLSQADAREHLGPGSHL